LPQKWCACPPGPPREITLNFRRILWWLAMTSLAVVVLITSYVQLFSTFRIRAWLPSPLLDIYEWTAPYRSFNGYGLFAVMTTSRPEIVVEGSNDGANWMAYEFKYKPGDLNRRPAFVEPHQPRLDWQMWFAALGDYQNNPWFVNFCARLLQGSPQVLALMGKNPFPKAPPKYIRAVVYDYSFTYVAVHRNTGDWWKRVPERIYLPKISLSSSSGGPSGTPARH
jgi:hypothetical protein